VDGHLVDDVAAGRVAAHEYLSGVGALGQLRIGTCVVALFLRVQVLKGRLDKQAR
jgi:hypothetical protein